MYVACMCEGGDIVMHCFLEGVTASCCKKMSV